MGSRPIQAAVAGPTALRALRSIQQSEPISRAKALPNELGSISGTEADTGLARRKPIVLLSWVAG